MDGLRALAIVSVVCFHINKLFIVNQGYSFSFLSNLPPFRGGWVGVPLFFVLSGFLIGGQLWKELTAKKNISFWRFILRRGFRIWPLYYFAVIVIYLFSGPNTFDLKGIISNLLFVGNYLSDTGPISGSWSLATEEQFYILAPLLLIFVNKIKPDKDLRYYRNGLFIIFFIPLIARFLTWDFVLSMKTYEINTYMQRIYRPFHTNCEGLIAGMIISNYYYDKKSNFNFSLKAKYILLIIGCVAFTASFLSKIYFNFTGVALGFSALLIYFLKTNSGKAIDIFSNNFLFIISKTSFAIYLIHFYVIEYCIDISLVKKLSFGIGGLEILVVTALVLGISTLISIFLYILIEKPFMLLREHTLKKL